MTRGGTERAGQGGRCQPGPQRPARDVGLTSGCRGGLGQSLLMAAVDTVVLLSGSVSWSPGFVSQPGHAGDHQTCHPASLGQG